MLSHVVAFAGIPLAVMGVFQKLGRSCGLVSPFLRALAEDRGSARGGGAGGGSCLGCQRYPCGSATAIAMLWGRFGPDSIVSGGGGGVNVIPKGAVPQK